MTLAWPSRQVPWPWEDWESWYAWRWAALEATLDYESTMMEDWE